MIISAAATKKAIINVYVSEDMQYDCVCVCVCVSQTRKQTMPLRTNIKRIMGIVVTKCLISPARKLERERE